MPPIALKAEAQTRRERPSSRERLDVERHYELACGPRASYAASESLPNASLFSFSNKPRPISDLSTTNRNCCTRPTRDQRRQRSDC